MKTIDESKINYEQFRTLFDCLSSEWNDTSFDEKIEKLKSLIAGNDLLGIVLGFRMFYRDKGYKDIDDSILFSLVEVMGYMLKKTN